MILYAGFWRRMIAMLVDFVVLTPIMVALFAAEGLSRPAAIASHLVYTALAATYPVYFLSRWGQTIGKWVAGIKVLRLDGGPLSPAHAWRRSSVEIVLMVVYLVLTIYTVATWTGPEWSSMNWFDRRGEMTQRTPAFWIYDLTSETWGWSELVVLLFNTKRRAVHDFIAGTIVVVVRSASLQPSTTSARAPAT